MFEYQKTCMNILEMLSVLILQLYKLQKCTKLLKDFKKIPFIFNEASKFATFA